MGRKDGSAVNRIDCSSKVPFPAPGDPTNAFLWPQRGHNAMWTQTHRERDTDREEQKQSETDRKTEAEEGQSETRETYT